jgi:pilus assembly protein CpaB
MRQWIRLVLLGLCVALIASWIARMLQPAPSALPRAESIDVVVAARDIDIGRVLSAEDLATERVSDTPKARTGVPLAAAAVGRTASSVIRKGQLVRDEDLASPGAGASLVSLVPPGQRAVTVALREPGPGPALYPGAFVDVLVTADIPSKASNFREAMTKTLIERSRVLAVNDLGIGGKVPAPDARERRVAQRQPTVTLLVTAEQSAQLELAMVRGTVGVALCAVGDGPGVPGASGVTTSGMLGITLEPDPAPMPPAPPPAAPEPKEPEQPAKPEPQAPAEPPKPEVWEVTVVRGDNTVKHPFPFKAPADPKAPAPPDAVEPKR